MAASLAAAGERLGYVQMADSQRFEPGAGHIDFPSIFCGARRDGLRRGHRHRVLGAVRAIPRSCCPAPRRCCAISSARASSRFDPSTHRQLVARGEIGGRTVRILETGDVDCHEYPVGPLRRDTCVSVP